MKHKEAFCIMKYRTNADEPVQEEEFIWNSRDGIVPFIVMSRTDKDKKLRHDDHSQDRVVMDYKPQPGERLFIEATRELLEPVARERVENNWHLLKVQFREKADAIERYLREWVKPGAPMLVTVQADGSYIYG